MNTKKIILTFIGITGLLFHSTFAEINTGKILLDIQFEGIHHTTTPSKNIFLTKIGRRVIESNLKKDLNQLYLSGIYNSVDAETRPSADGVILVFKLKENPIVKNIMFIGNSLFSEQNLLNRLQNRIGHVLNLKKLDQDKTTLTQFYLEQGYALFQLHHVYINANRTLVFSLSEGKVDNVTFSGLNTIQPFVCQRAIKLKKGSVFNSKTLRQDREKLIRIGYFSQVSSPKLSLNKTKTRVNIHYEIQERKANLLDIGLEQGKNRILGFFKIDTNHILTHSDLLSNKVQISNENNNQFDIKSYRIGYSQPWFLNWIPISFKTHTWREQDQEFFSDDIQKTTLKDTLRYGWDVSFGIPLIEDLLNLNLIYKSEDVRPQATDDFTRYDIRSLTGSLQYRTIKNPYNPREGAYWTLQIEKGGEIGAADLGGLEFTRAIFNHATFWPILNNTTLGLRSFVGAFFPSDANIRTFESEGFTIGGVSSLRGYKESNPFVGNKQLLFNLEIRHDLTQDFQLALFADAGKTFAGNFTFTPTTFNTGHGIGIRYFTPVGPIRFDLAFGETWILHFSLGQMF